MTRLGGFRKVWATKFLTKIDLRFGDFLGYFEIKNFLSKNYVAIFGASLENFGLLFYSNI